MLAMSSDVFRPITSSSSTAAKQQADEDQKKAVLNDSSLTAEEKAKMLARIDLTKLEKHTPKDEARMSAEEIRDIEVRNAFAMADDSIFGLVPVEGVPGEYVFGIINVLDKLGMLRDNVDPRATSSCYV